jgi:integrase
MRKAMRGLGLVYQPTYRDKKTGERKTSAVWWIQYSVDGTVHRESAETIAHPEAIAKLKAKLGAVGRGEPAIATEQRKLTVGQLTEGYLKDYERRNLRSIDTAKGRTRHLTEFFGTDCKVLALSTDRIVDYQLHRKQENAEPATINRETSALARMLALAIKARKLTWKPAFPDRLEEAAPRQGFFEHSDYLAIRKHFRPAVYQDGLDFGYYSGCRREEILGMLWSEVDQAGGVIRLSPERSKTKEPRVIPLSPPLREVIKRRLRERRLDCPFVFHNGGRRIGDWRKSWWKACKAAKLPGKLFHDLRRTVARNLIRSGTGEGVAMRLTGHKTRNVFERYNIVSETDLHAASARLAEHVSAQAEAAKTNEGYK